MLLFNLLRSAALTLLLFLLVYIPAFAIAGAMHLSPNVMVPAVIALTLVMASILMGFAIRRDWLTPADLGWRWPAYKYVIYAFVFAVPLSVLVTLLLAHVNEQATPEGTQLEPWQAYLCFALAAPVQEEAIFRGLLQSILTRRLLIAPVRIAWPGLAASLSIAALFGITHLVVGPVTACAACLLGVLAGELKRRSGSLLPSMLCHAIFNLGGLFMLFG